MNGFTLLAEGAAAAESLSIFDPASPPAESIRILFLLVVGVCAVIFVIVEGTLLYNLFRFKPKPGETLRVQPDGRFQARQGAR